ncbi:MAG: type II CAAX endopeptidase family protein [Methanobrevibacter sp.]|uniref:CPBP family intramembrane glutamic endopeptidase n=1 Tax=Methanobrevibacter sp. TaxID=66852 RepID=UPI0026E080FB|nr:type II CAAX endopeptidase family protein [Methanobrevibacter sp.]MDO5849043.1 type II CAAX endopeptidase family protein [Methanobrevibacter sp.]
MKQIAKKDFSRIGFSYLTMGILAIVSQIFIAVIVSKFNPEILTNVNITTTISFVCQYIVPFPVLYLLLKKIEKTDIERHSLSLRKFAICFCITFALMYIGNIIGLSITGIIEVFKHTEVINPIVNLINSSSIMVNLILISLIAPIFEEIFFRKFLIDRTIKYGAKISIILSALMFGLFHGNLNQFFYAFFLGGFFACIYIKTGKIIYPIILHMLTNTFGSVVTLAVQSLIESLGNTIFGIGVNIAYFLILAIVLVIGLAYIIKWSRIFGKFKNNIENPLKTSLLNVGMALFILFFVIEIVYTIIV